MVDISARSPMSSPPDRRIISQLTQDPKLIKYLENLWFDVTGTEPENFELLLGLIISAFDLAGAAQGSANTDKQGIEELALAMQAISRAESGLANLVRSLSGLPEVVQPSDQAIQSLQRKVDDLESLLVEIRPPIIPTTTPLFAPTVITVTAGYSVLSAPPYQPLTVRADATTAGLTVALPAAPALLQLVNVKKVDATANVVTISGGAINIDGGLTVAVGSQYTNLQVQYNGATWDVL